MARSFPRGTTSTGEFVSKKRKKGFGPKQRMPKRKAFLAVVVVVGPKEKRAKA